MDEDDSFLDWLSQCHATVVEADGTAAVASLPLDLDIGVIERLEAATACLQQLEDYRRWRDSLRLSAASDDESSELSTNWNDEALPEQLGRFRIERELGRGGQAIVYLAVDPLLQRRVALKLLRPELLLSKSMRRRFLREAQVTAQLSHPHLLSIYETGQAGPLCYIASVYCSGPTLHQWLIARSEPIAEQLAARIAQRLAEATDYAHQRGVLHRDIKPGNVFLEVEEVGMVPLDDTQQMATPKLGDFGMARIDSAADVASLDATRTGALVGTPAYMAPEQAIGQQERIGPATDVYALGLLLYELLTRQSPFRGLSDVDTLRRVLNDDPPPLSHYRQGISADLAAICQKCLEKSPQQRYASARALADDLERFCTGLPTLARPLSTPARLWRWIQRHPAAASLWGVIVAAATALVATVLLSNTWLRAERDRTQVALQASQASAYRAQSLLYSSDIERAQQAVLHRDAANAKSLLSQYLPAPGEPDHREFGWHFLWRTLHREQRRFPQHPGDVYATAFSPDGKLLATACEDGKTRIWDYAHMRVISEFAGHQGEVNCVAFSPDGAWLATGGDDGVAILWDVSAGLPLHRFDHTTEGKQVWIHELAISPDATRLYAVADGDVCVWDLKSTSLIQRLIISERPIKDLDLSCDGSRLALSAGWDAQVYRTDTWNKIFHVTQTSPAKGRQWMRVCFLPDGDRIVLGCTHGNCAIYDVNTEERLGYFGSPLATSISDIACSPDGRHVVASSEDGSLAVFLTEDRVELSHLLSHGNRAWSVRFAPDGETFVSTDADGEVLVWQTPLDQELALENGIATPRFGLTQITAANYTPDRRKLVLAGLTDDGHTIRFVDRATKQVADFQVDESFEKLCLTPDNRFVVAETSDNRIVLLDVHTRELKTLGQLTDAAHCIDISPHGDLLAVATRTVALYDLQSGRERLAFDPLGGRVDVAKFASDGTLLIGGPGALITYDIERGAVWTIREPGDEFFDVAWFPDGKRLAVAEGRRGASIRDRASGEVLTRLSGHLASVQAVSVSHDGRNVASICNYERLIVWDANTGRSVLSFEGVSSRRGNFTFCPSGGELIVLTRDASTGLYVLDERAIETAPANTSIRQSSND